MQERNPVSSIFNVAGSSIVSLTSAQNDLIAIYPIIEQFFPEDLRRFARLCLAFRLTRQN